MIKKLGLLTLMLAIVACSPKTSQNKITEAPMEDSGLAKDYGDSLVEATGTRSTKAISGNVVYFDTEVVGITVDVAIDALEAALKTTEGTVYLLISSPGGSVFEGTRLTDFVEKSGRIDTVCVGICASMAAHLHQVGKHRLMTGKSVLMFHPASGGLSGTVPEMKSLLSMIDSYTARLDAKIAKRSGIDRERFNVLVTRNLWAEAEDAMKMKLADGVVTVSVPNLDSSRVSGKAIARTMEKIRELRRLYGPKDKSVKQQEDLLQSFINQGREKSPIDALKSFK